jgi:hypothetical protein
MSRVIDMDRISEVLPSGWIAHTVQGQYSNLLFVLVHEYIRDRAPAAEGLQFAVPMAREG